MYKSYFFSEHPQGFGNVLLALPQGLHDNHFLHSCRLGLIWTWSGTGVLWEVQTSLALFVKVLWWGSTPFLAVSSQEVFPLALGKL